MKHETPIFVLGAGRASRFGSDKHAALLNGKPLGQWAVDAALSTGHTVFWIGRDGASFVPEGVTERHINPMANQGLGTSVAMAARLAAARGVQAALITLADMPLVSSAMLNDLLVQTAPAAFRHEDGRPGVPALIPARLFPEAQGLRQDAGAAALLRGLDDLTLITPPSGALADVDTPEALQAIAGKFTQ